MTATRAGYSYIRFSAKKQEKGDSIRRQTELRDNWLARHPETLLDESLRADLGRSAFRGRKQKELLAFVARIEAGDVQPGSVLIVEALDRISREGVDEGYDLCKSILRAGISIATLAPEREYGPDAVKGLMKGALELQFYLEAAHEYSQALSRRIGRGYEGRRKKVREGKAAVVGGVLPAWCRLVKGSEEPGRQLVGGKIVLDPEKAAAVRRVFDLAAAGYGATQIVRKLTSKDNPPEAVAPIGKRARWNVGYVLKLIRDRRVLGEYLPSVEGQPDWPPIFDYFPRVIDNELYRQVRAGAAERTAPKFRGRPSKDAVANLFQGLITNAVTGERVVLRSNNSRTGGRIPVLVDAGFGHNDWRSFPYAPFERLVRSQLRELDPAKVLGTSGSNVPSELDALRDERDEVKARVAELEAELRVGDIAPIARALREQVAREEALAARIEELARAASRPLLPAWEEAQKLLAAEEDGPGREDARVRLRAALRAIIDRMAILVVSRKLERMAAVQIDFRDGGRRQYLLYHRRQYYNFRETVPAIERGLSFREARLPEAIDLLDREQAGELEAALLAVEWPEA